MGSISTRMCCGRSIPRRRIREEHTAYQLESTYTLIHSMGGGSKVERMCCAGRSVRTGHKQKARHLYERDNTHTCSYVWRTGIPNRDHTRHYRRVTSRNAMHGRSTRAKYTHTPPHESYNSYPSSGSVQWTQNESLVLVITKRFQKHSPWRTRKTPGLICGQHAQICSQDGQRVHVRVVTIIAQNAKSAPQ